MFDRAGGGFLAGRGQGIYYRMLPGEEFDATPACL